MARSGSLAALVLLLATINCQGQDTPPPPPVPYQPEARVPVVEEWTVKVETFNNKGVTGKLRLASVVMDCELGLLELKLDKIKMIQLSKPQDPQSPFEMVETQRGLRREGSVVINSGEVITGSIYVPAWAIETELGTLTPDPKRLKTLTFVSKTSNLTKNP